VLSVFGSSVVILATVAGAIVLLFVLRSFWSSELRRVHNDVIGWHVSVIGSTYAVIVGFMLFAVWSNFETAENIADSEANCLVNVVRSSRGLAPSSHEQIRRLALQYANVMLSDEWPAMEQGRVSPASHAIIQQLWVAVTDSPTHTSLEQTSLDHTFGELARMTEYRRSRQLQANSYLPGILWLVLVLGATITIVSACLFGTADFKLHLIQVTMLALMISSVLTAVADINLPFQGAVHITAECFERARTAIVDFK
jgi:hypothetical protein